MSLFDAWIDESGSNQRADPGTYVLSAGICERHQAEAIREVMRGLLVGKRHRKLHWRDEDRPRQHAIASAIAGTGIEHLVVVRSHPTTTEHPERQRRLCMERLLPELVAMGVGQAIVESRGLKDDQKDRRTLDNLRRKRALGGHLHLDHVGGPADPMLWIPDACCGAVTQHRCGDSEHYALIESKVTMIEIRP
ncbi:hypothetical protein DAVIS_02040 [Mycobacterium marinum]|uniref:DUF3800 domain-containing protein n=1 Tax=Mycobacterium marinum TaxID=1781 RepID=A0A3E2MXP4_MYCMR|nr:hypothetical protein [Mycobacterium marinum]RFZ42948.1 hypothetical protein DAVIS_02040 [Mycobacterium marinum]